MMFRFLAAARNRWQFATHLSVVSNFWHEVDNRRLRGGCFQTKTVIRFDEFAWIQIRKCDFMHRNTCLWRAAAGKIGRWWNFSHSAALHVDQSGSWRKPQHNGPLVTAMLAGSATSWLHQCAPAGDKSLLAGLVENAPNWSSGVCPNFVGKSGVVACMHVTQGEVPLGQCWFKQRRQWDSAYIWKCASETVLKNVGGKPHHQWHSVVCVRGLQTRLIESVGE